MKIKPLFLTIIILLESCYDTRSFENVRLLKSGMNIKDVEGIIGEPISYKRLNDSMEERVYVYDNPGNGVDMPVEVVFMNEKIISVKQ